MNAQPWILEISVNHQARELTREADQYQLACEAAGASSATRGSVAARLAAQLVRAISSILPTARTRRQAV